MDKSFIINTEIFTKKIHFDFIVKLYGLAINVFIIVLKVIPMISFLYISYSCGVFFPFLFELESLLKLYSYRSHPFTTCI